MIKVLFMIPNLGHGGAEKVLVNLVNHMDLAEFDITVMALYDDNGVNKNFLSPDITYKYCFKKSFPGVAHILKFFTPKQLYDHLVKEEYDIVVSYLEGQTARIISGCSDGKTKKICWIHKTMNSMSDAARLFRSINESRRCYECYDGIVSVSKDVQKAFMNFFSLAQKGVVLYNTSESDRILELANEPIDSKMFSKEEIKLCAMGSLIHVKGFERLIEVHRRLKMENYPVHTYILGEGPDRSSLIGKINRYGLSESVTLLGYQRNPYSYLKECDLFVCSSFSEGFSTAVTEALILGIPVISTDVSGIRELLGEKNEYGIVTRNEETALYKGIKDLIKYPGRFQYYKEKAIIRGQLFETKKTVRETEDYLKKFVSCELCNGGE